MMKSVRQRVSSLIRFASERPRVAQSPAAGGATQAGGRFTLCAEGTYSAYAVFPGQGGTLTAVAKPGGCVSMAMASADKVTADIWGADPAGRFYVGSLIFGDEGADVAAKGTREDPGLVVL
jgi:hypothetical protein